MINKCLKNTGKVNIYISNLDSMSQNNSQNPVKTPISIGKDWLLYIDCGPDRESVVISNVNNAAGNIYDTLIKYPFTVEVTIINPEYGRDYQLKETFERESQLWNEGFLTKEPKIVLVRAISDVCFRLSNKYKYKSKILKDLDIPAKQENWTILHQSTKVTIKTLLLQ